MTSARVSGEAGFTVVEVVVALAVVSLAFSYAVPGLSAGLDRIGRNRNSLVASSLAQSLLDRVGNDIALQPGDVAGRTPDGFAWKIGTTAYAETPRNSPLAGYVVQVTVDWLERGNPRSTGIATVRLAPRAVRR